VLTGCFWLSVEHPIADDLRLPEGARASSQTELRLLDFAFSPNTLPDVREAIKVRCVTWTFRRHEVISHTQKELAEGVFVLLDGVVQAQLSDGIVGLTTAEESPAAVGLDVPLERGAVFSNLVSVKKVKQREAADEKKHAPPPKGVGVAKRNDVSTQHLLPRATLLLPLRFRLADVWHVAVAQGTRVASISVATESASALWIPAALFEFAHDPHSLKDVGVAAGAVEASSDEDSEDAEVAEDEEDRVDRDDSVFHQANAAGLAEVNRRLDAQQQTLDELKRLLLVLQPAGVQQTRDPEHVRLPEAVPAVALVSL
jgi:hypothetical protein